MMRLFGAARQQRRREAGMSGELSRRETLKQAMALAAALSVPDWVLPALAQGEVDVPFTDVPDTFNPRPADGNRRSLDLRAIDGPITPNDQFFFIQHYDRPEIDGTTYKLKLTGLVDRPIELSLADIKGMKPVDIVCGYECSGNSPRGMQGLSSCGRFTGVRLRDVLRRVGVDDKAREVVFFGADKGAEDVVFRQNTLKVQQQFGRSITLENAMKPEPLLAWALNGQPLDRDHGFPLRLIMPGWYGVANVKWLSEIRLQEERFLGNYQARWYRTVRAVGGTGELTDPATLAKTCKPNRGSSDNPLFLLNHWIDTSPAPKPSNAAQVNDYKALLARAQKCERLRHQVPNLVAVDFYATGDLMKVIDKLNEVSEPAP